MAIELIAHASGSSMESRAAGFDSALILCQSSFPKCTYIYEH